MKAPAGTFWIGGEHPFDLHEVYLDFRADLTLAQAPASAILRLTADSRYRLWINGQPVGYGPERSWPGAMAVDAHDVSTWLRAGANAIAVQVYGPGYSHFSYVHRAACGLLAWLEVEGVAVLCSDASWRVRRDPAFDAGVRRVSIYGSGVEDRDLRRASNWQTDPSGDWAPARILQPPQGPIWGSLRPRATPQPIQTRRALTTPWQTRLGPSRGAGACPDPHAVLRAVFAASVPAAVPDRLPAGQAASWIFDLGHSQTCLAAAEITARGGETLLISFAEKLRDGALVLPDPETYCRMRPTDRFILRPGRQRAEGFTPRGARYLVFQLEGADLDPAPVFSISSQTYPLQEHALPDLGAADLNAVAAMCRRTTRACLQDGFVDSIWRESSQWLGDAVPQAFALAAVSDDPRPLRFALEMAAQGAEPGGFLPSILPGDVPAYAVTDYTFSWVELLQLYTHHPGARDSAEVLDRLWPCLTRLLRLWQDSLIEGVLHNPAGRRLFLDWSPMERTQPNLTLNLRYLHALRLATGLADLCGQPDPWTDQAQALARRLAASHWTPQGWRESPGGAPASQLALALLILTGLATGDEAGALADRIVARSLDPDDVHWPGKLVLASPFMHHYVFAALDLLGRRDAIRQIIALRWGRWAAAGEPTTWENWDISFPDGSACHGFSAHPLGWLVR